MFDKITFMLLACVLVVSTELVAESTYQVEQLNKEEIIGFFDPDLINNRGQVYGYYENAIWEKGFFYWDRESGIVPVVQPGHEGFTMNEHGEVYGVTSDQFFIWRKGQGFEYLPMLEEFETAFVETLSANGKGDFVATAKKEEKMISCLFIDGNQTFLDSQSDIWKELIQQGFQPIEVGAWKIDEQGRIYGGFNEFEPNKHNDTNYFILESFFVAKFFVYENGTLTVIDYPSTDGKGEFYFNLSTENGAVYFIDLFSHVQWIWDSDNGFKVLSNSVFTYEVSPNGTSIGISFKDHEFVIQTRNGPVEHLSEAALVDEAGDAIVDDPWYGNPLGINDQRQIIFEGGSEGPVLWTPIY